jgi:Fe/S biogenesis protein NfuA
MEVSMITVTEAARNKILELMEAEGQKGLALRLAIRERGPGGFKYDLHFVKEEDKSPDDKEVDAGGFKVYIDAESAQNLEGATIDYVQGIFESGFKIDNPNTGWSDPIASKVQHVIDTQINPGVASHGGFVTLLDVKDDVAYIAFGGGCQGCGLADVTLKQGIEVIIKQAVPEIRQVVDTTDHAGGTNPYYQPAKGGDSSGESPLV